MVAAPVRPARQRIVGLDGLRGVAALVVVVHHCLLLSPEWLRPYLTPRGAEIPGITWAFTYTPLHLLWDGPVAVFVFFVLSGFVLTLPFRYPPRAWAAYYPARVVRLYVPVWAAVALAVIWVAAVPHMQEGDAWVRSHPGLSAGGVARDLLLVAGAPGATNSALWSLRWEAVFSLLLPAFVAFAVLLRRFLLVKLLLLTGLLLIGAVLGGGDDAFQLPALFQLPIFGIGCLIAVNWERVSETTANLLASRWRVAGAATLVVGALSSYWIVCAFTADGAVGLAAASRVIQVLGAALLVILCAALPSWGAALTRRFPLWLGTRSFSLYLVHEPLITALGKVLPLAVLPWLALLIGIPLSLLLAEAFFRAVERPSHRLSRAVSRLVAIRRASSATPTAPTPTGS